MVGSRLANLIADKCNDISLSLFGNKSANRRVAICNKCYTVLPVHSVVEQQLDIVAFCTEAEVSAKWIPKLTAKGVACVDNSSYFRNKRGVPLIVPGVNDSSLPTSLLYCNPNCTTIAVAIALKPLLPLGLSSVQVVTMQAASGAGSGGLEDLTSQAGYGRLKQFAHPIWDNVIPAIGQACTSGYTTEEIKLQKELKKILELPRLAVNSFCCRVPVTVGHCAVVTVRVKSNVSVDCVRRLLSTQSKLLLLDEAQSNLYPMPMMLRQTSLVGVGRVVKCGQNRFNMFVVEDNLLRGAAYNAYEIVQQLVDKMQRG